MVVDFSAHADGDLVTMVNERGEGTTAQVMRFVVTGTTEDVRDGSRLPDRLADPEVLSEADVVATREFTFRRGGHILE